jgi:pyruvate dehydrogenase E2 component (dihydrolipoamide acetyltransferase)
LHDADQLSLDELMAALRDLSSRARAGRLRGSEMTDATITVTNLGERGVRSVFGVIYPPQVALVGFGKISDRVWDVDNGLGIRPAVTVTLAADHRASDGHVGATFLSEIAHRLHNPEEL